MATNKEFQVKLQSETKQQVTEKEEVSWIAWSQTSKKNGLYFADVTGKVVNHKATKLKIKTDAKGTPFVFAQLMTSRSGETAGLRYRKRTNQYFQVEIEEETTKLTNSRKKKESVGYLAIFGSKTTKSLMKADQVDACTGIKGYDKKCPGLSGWHKKTNFDKFTDAETCTALVKTKGNTCKSFCNKQNKVCLYA
jgi:hypothetical protein